MSPSIETTLQRMGRCEADLAANGIELTSARGGAMRLLVRQHLDYFQLMLGYDAGPREIMALAKRLKSPRGQSSVSRGEQ